MVHVTITCYPRWHECSFTGLPIQDCLCDTGAELNDVDITVVEHHTHHLHRTIGKATVADRDGDGDGVIESQNTTNTLFTVSQNVVETPKHNAIR